MNDDIGVNYLEEIYDRKGSGIIATPATKTTSEAGIWNATEGLWQIQDSRTAVDAWYELSSPISTDEAVAMIDMRQISGGQFALLRNAVNNWSFFGVNGFINTWTVNASGVTATGGSNPIGDDRIYLVGYSFSNKAYWVYSSATGAIGFRYLTSIGNGFTMDSILRVWFGNLGLKKIKIWDRYFDPSYVQDLINAS